MKVQSLFVRIHEERGLSVMGLAQRREEIYVNKNRGFTTIEILKRSDSPITPN